MKSSDCNREIISLTSLLIKEGIAEEFNFPAIKEDNTGIDVTFSGAKDLSTALKDVSYSEIHGELVDRKLFNFRFADNALLQMNYRYDSHDNLKKHRLCYFPSPTLEPYQNAPEVYDEDLIYADIVAKNVLPVPIRFDYDPKAFTSISHPQSHLTIGQYKNCRIPVQSPLRPTFFIHFILSSFYRKKYEDMEKPPLIDRMNRLRHTVTNEEKLVLHIAF